MAGQSTQIFITRNHIAYAVLFLVCLTLPLGLFTKYYFLPFAALAALIICYIILAKPYVGLIIYSVFLLVRPQEFISVLENSPIPIERSLALLLIVSMVLKLLRKGFRIRYSRIDYGILAFVLAGLLSITTSLWVSHSIDKWVDLLRLFIIYILMVQLIDSKRQLKFFILFAILASAFHAFASTFNYYTGTFQSNIAMHIDRAVGIDKSFSGPNSLAATLVYTLPFMYYYYFGERSKRIKLLLIAITPVIIWCIILTGSRTGMAGVLFFIMLILWQGKNKLRNMLIAVLFLVSAWVAMPDQYRDRFQSTTDLSSGTSASVSARARVDGFTKGVRMVLDKPLFGYGMGNYTTASGTLYSVGDWHEAHSLPGQLLGEVGLIGTFAFVIWIYLLFQGLRKLKTMYPPHRDKFLYLTTIGLYIQLFCLFFLGLAGHNLYRYNWFIISALVTVMLHPSFWDRLKTNE